MSIFRRTSSVMFKLQLVLVIFVGALLNAIEASEQLIATAKLKDTSLNITLMDPEEIILPSEVEIHRDLQQKVPFAWKGGNLINTKNENLESKYDNADYIEGDLILSSDFKRDRHLQQIKSLARKGIRLIHTENLEYEVNAEEGDHIEGDLLLPSNDRIFQSSLSIEDSIWPKGLVPYRLDNNFTPEQNKIILNVFDQFAEKTCIRFYPRRNERDYISVESVEAKCASNVGRVGGKQIVELSDKCFRLGTIMHELMHAIGFVHEQNRYDRDDYVQILSGNLKPGTQENFRKFSKKETANLGTPYDYGSILHYREKAYTKNGKPTIKALKKLPEGVIMGQRNGFSKGDLQKIYQRYKCA